MWTGNLNLPNRSSLMLLKKCTFSKYWIIWVRQVKYWVKNNAQLYETVYLRGTHLSEWNICLKNGQIWHLTWLEFAREFCQSGTCSSLRRNSVNVYIKNQDEFNDYHRRHFDGKRSSIFVPTKRPNKILDPFYTKW